MKIVCINTTYQIEYAENIISDLNEVSVADVYEWYMVYGYTIQKRVKKANGRIRQRKKCFQFC